jgi:2-polyprenyl-3-methyl-5-hydroxy-6-metoxy-1,4-benzoquinol methylase
MMTILDELDRESDKILTKVGVSKAASYRSLVGNDKLHEIFSIAAQQKTKEKTTSALDYGIVKYIKYEYSSRSDHAKKILEKNIVERYLLNSHLPSEGKPISLDIGCATCRYPLWLSANGFHAVGYDIDDDAIKICQMRAEGNNNVHIEKKNILEFEPEHDRYSLITCMMGTFNHIPLASQGKFVHWIYDSLKSGGVFIFSSWNKECPYTTHLHFYNREEREYIQNNTETPANIEVLLKDNGFIVDNFVPIVFLPDECYEAWLGELAEADLATIDQYLLNVLTGSNSQMYVFCAAKA